MTLKERCAKLDEQKASIIAEMNNLFEAADTEERDLTEEEEKKFADLEARLEKCNRDIERVRKVLAEEVEIKQQKPTRVYITPNKSAQEFKKFGELLYHMVYNPTDERLRPLAAETREMSMSVGPSGGYMVPPQFVSQLRMVEPQAAVFRSRATVIPAGDPPDASVTMPALDQGIGSNVYGGATVTWIAEGATKNETDVALREITLTPNEVAAYTVVTDKLLRNWEAADSVISGLLRNAITGAEESAFYNGSGVGRPLGVVNAPAAKVVNREVANSISYTDLVNMLAAFKPDARGLWIGSPTIISKLLKVKDDAGQYIWIPNSSGAAAQIANMLLGMPLVFSERSVTLGTKGDLILVDLSYYLIKDGSGPFVATSPHVHFTSNKTVIKVFWNVDGKPWLDGPLPLEGSNNTTVSPIVVLE